jgi:hypothetical protein
VFNFSLFFGKVFFAGLEKFHSAAAQCGERILRARYFFWHNLFFFVQVWRRSIRRSAMRRKNTSCSLWPQCRYYSFYYSVYLLYQDKGVRIALRRKNSFFFWCSLWPQYRHYSVTTQMTCFTSTQVQIMTSCVPPEYFVLAMAAEDQ